VGTHQVSDLVRIVSVLAPHHRHLETLRRFVSERLPPGFPVRVSIPVFPTVYVNGVCMCVCVRVRVHVLQSSSGMHVRGHWHDGGAEHSKADVRFLEYEEAPQDPSLFVVPADYQEGTLDMLDGGDDDD
jgi:hypothetical protein